LSGSITLASPLKSLRDSTAGLELRLLKTKVAVSTILAVARRLVVRCDDSFVVAQDNALLVIADHIVRHDGDFSTTARRVDYIGRNSKTARVSTQVLDYFYALGHRRSKMRNPARHVALINVVRPHTNGEQLLNELFHDDRAVVYVAEQHGLVSKLNTCVG